MRHLGGTRTRLRRRAAAAGAAALCALLVASGTGPDASAQVIDSLPGVTVHDDPSCVGGATGTVTESFSVRIHDLLGGPLAGVTVLAGDTAVASVMVALDDAGAGCADLPSIDAGSYLVVATAGDATAGAPVVVEAGVAPPPVAPDPGPTPTVPAPTPSPDPAPAEPTPGTTDPAPGAGGATGSPSGAPSGVEAAPRPTGSALASAGATPAPVGVPASGRRTETPSPSAPPLARAGAAAPSAAPAPSPSGSRAAGPTEMLRAVLTSSDRPTAVTVAGFVVLEMVGVTLLVAFVVLVVSRRPRRRG